MATERLSVPISTELKSRLEREAQLEERSASHLAVKAIEAMLRNQADKRTAIRMAVEEAEKGAFISQEAMDAWVASWGTGAKNAPPEPDIFPDQNDP